MSLEALNAQDYHHLRAAEGWLGLGDYLSANSELEEITAQARAHPAILQMRYAIYAKAERWEMAAGVAEAIAAMLPDKVDSWLNLAYATRRKKGGGIPEAQRILLVAQVKFPHECLVPFNLACYCAQLRALDEATMWIQKAIAIDTNQVQKLAVDDPDLKPLWDSMKGTIWKRE